ncbi:MAG: flagellar motor protein MotD [Chromatiales bacterium]|nr:flagellar motor protein MotD [Chromatiales bacterium]
MARRKHHEEHVNHEAWAIPYGDLVTLLLAFFVVMYAVSSVNEGKYRVLSDSLVAAFRGQPHTMEPIQIGQRLTRVQHDDTVAGISPSQVIKLPEIQGLLGEAGPGAGQRQPENDQESEQLRRIASDLELALERLIYQDLIRIRRDASWIEVEIKTDMLFPSGSAEISDEAISVLQELAATFSPFDYRIRVEGHTDNVPISTLQFPSNWELSAARAARIVRLFESSGISSTRLMVAGMGEHQPVADNESREGRDRNRRVTLVVLGHGASATASLAAGPRLPDATLQDSPDEQD